MQLRTDPGSRLCRLTLTCLMAITWCGVPRLVTAAPPSPAPAVGIEQLQKLADSLDETLKLYAAIDRDLPRDGFDPAALLKQVGPDETKLFEWVRDHTRFVPYRGALRGAAGVLMDRSGNSLDRSLLLARLLQSAGRETRLAHCQLTDAQAENFLNLAWEKAPALAAPVVENDAATNAFLVKWAGDHSLNLAEIQWERQRGRALLEKTSEELAAGVSEQTDRLLAILKPVAADSAIAHATAKARIMEHWWLQVNQNGKWGDLDVMLPDARAGTRIAEPAGTIDLKGEDVKLPLNESQCQSIELRVIAEQWKGDKIETHVALHHTLRPADLGSLPVTLAISPPIWPKDFDPTGPDAAALIRTALIQQSMWMPALRVGEETIVQNGFDDHGNLVDKPMDAIAGAGKAAATSANKAASALDAVLNDKPAVAEGKLTAAWVEFECRVPGEKSRVIRREYFDLYGPARRAAGKLTEPAIDETTNLMRGMGLFHTMDLLATGAVLTENFVTHEQLQRSLKNGPSAVAALRGAGRKPARESFSDVARKSPLPAPLYALAGGRRGAEESSGIAIDEPNLFALHHMVTFTAKGRMPGRTAVDIIFNSTAFRPGAGIDSFNAQVRQGVMETLMESKAMGSHRTDRNAAKLFSASAAQNIEWIKLRGAEDPGLARLKLSANARARIAADLRSGFVVVAPVSPVNSRAIPQTGWWRIDSDGNCVGYMANGLGTEMAEYASILVAIFESAWAIMECTTEYSGWGALGCSVCGVAIAVAMAFVGGGKWFGELVVGHGMAKLCSAFGGKGEGGGEGGGGEGGGGEGGGGPNFTPSGGSTPDPGMSSVGGGE